MQFVTLYRSKIEFSETYFFDILAIHHDHPSYVKHVVDCTYVFFTIFGYVVFGGGGGLPMEWYTICECSFSPCTARNSKFPELGFLILWSLTMTIQAM